MNDLLSQYYQRAPRYILVPQDRCLIRVAGPKQTPWEEGTEILNVSKSGLCFTAPEILVPHVGEFIRIQFHIPGAKQMACHGKVVRIEKLELDLCLVGIEFESLTSVQKWNLIRGLQQHKSIENDDLLEVRSGGRVPWVQIVFYVSVGLSLFFSAFLLAGIYEFLVDPLWMKRLEWLLKSIFGIF